MSFETMKTIVLVVPFALSLVMLLFYCVISRKWKVASWEHYLGYALISCAMGAFGHWLFRENALETYSEMMTGSLIILILSVLLVFCDFFTKIFYDEEGFYTGISFLKKDKYLYRDISSYSIGEKTCVLNVGTEVMEWEKCKEVEKFIQYAVEQSEKIRNRELENGFVSGTEVSFDEDSHEVRRFLLQSKITKVALVLGFVVMLCVALIDVNENNTRYIEGKITDWSLDGKMWCFHVEGLEKELKIVIILTYIS